MYFYTEKDIAHFTSNIYILENLKVNFYNNYPTNIYE